jgi:hypothetical protein
MIKHSSPSALDNKEQLIVGLLTSCKLLLVALSCVVLFFVLVCKALVGFAMVVLTALNMGAEWIIGMVASLEEVKSFASFLGTAG